jgi:hypothetical protein
VKAGLLCAALAICGCQTYGAFSEPTTLPKGRVRLGVAVASDTFRASDERFSSPDLEIDTSVGVSDRTELDFLLTGTSLDFRVKQALVAPGVFALALSTGLGIFTAYSAHSTAVYVPLQLVAGVQPTPGVVFFAGPSVWGGLGLDFPTVGAGFNRGTWGLMAGGVAGLALEDPRFTFCPQVTVLTPIATGASGSVIQVSFGLGTQVR